MYFVAIVLPTELNKKILKYKTMMADKFNCKAGLKSPAHITLVPPFWMEEEKAQQLIYDIDRLAAGFSVFTVSTHNFSAFKPRTIFLALRPNENLNQIKAAANDFFGGNPFYGAKIDNRPFHPHITIATRDLYKKDFYEIWPWFAEKEFIEEWTATEISILRHNKKNWDVAHTSQVKTKYLFN